MNKLFRNPKLTFLLTLMLCFPIILLTVINRIHIEQLKMEQLISEKCTAMYEVISRLLYKTETIATYVIQNNGNLEAFEQIAASVVDDPSMLNIIVAPNGVVSGVYPLEGNEAVIGLDFFSEGNGNKEAILAKEMGQLVFGGPFELVQGGQALVGRLPVYLTKPGGSRHFWGIVSVGLKYPHIFERFGLSDLQTQGFAYEIWRTSPDTGERQVISGSGSVDAGSGYVESKFTILNAEWYFRVLPLRAWYQYSETWISILIALFVSLLVAFVTKHNSDLNDLKIKFEDLASKDPLTGIYNRRTFIELAQSQIERAIRLDGSVYIIIFDIDNFKTINDLHGHTEGDKILINVTKRVQKLIRPYDIFARYGGDEFIILTSDISSSDVQKLSERLRNDLASNVITEKVSGGSLHASFGVAPVLDKDGLHNTIQLADAALYRAKSRGRNKVVFETGRTASF